MNILNANEWAAISGLLPIHLTAEGNMDRFIMLDGGFYDFCLDLTKEERSIKLFIRRLVVKCKELCLYR